jgi:ABC-type branched-subunit amino acid transport system permease subunit
VFGTTVALLVAYYLFFHADATWITVAIQAAILSTIFLSITVITGMAGEISLSVATFAGLGACATAQLATNVGMAVIPAMLVGAVIAAAVGALLAIPALRLGGIFLSLATFAFALFFDSVMVKFTWVGGGALPIEAPRPTIGTIDFEQSDKNFLLLCLIVLIVVSVAVIAIREGTTGRVLDALRGSETAATAIGISATRARIVVFALSAAIAAIGGGMMAMNERAANYTPQFVSFQGLVFVVLVVSLGSRTVEGAIQAAIGYAAFQVVVLNQAVPWIANHLQPWYHMGEPPQTLAIILLSIGAFTYAKHPEGVLEYQKRRSLDRVQRWIDRWKGRRDAEPATDAYAPSDFTPTPSVPRA